MHVVLGSSTTQLFRNLSATLTFQPGDEVILSGIDHEANIAPWVALAERQQLVIKWWRPASTDEPKLLAADLKPLLSPRTRLVTCTHASNILGTIHDIKAICTTVHTARPTALVCVDSVAYAPHRQIDVKDLGVDIYAFSWYKVYGPHISMLYANAETTQKHMGSLGHFFNPHATLENKLGLAGASYELVSGIPAVTTYLEDVGWEVIMKQEAELQSALLEYLNGRGDVTIRGERSADGKVRVPTVSFTVKGWDSKELVETVEKETRFGFRWGAFYSNRLVNEFLGLGKDGVVRVSMVHYNTVDEVKAFIDVLDKTLSKKD
ncbi:putative cysteine desulfurase [Cytospora mali]|uniref:Cysteine desulfurase n=1 Tax=Cytospora mali TaxID=578113 RepID=A0A194V1P4_CYTMA|nr:putative cysteine desulfurase [Valsa mali var. pyri (nom. inval.)]